MNELQKLLASFMSSSPAVSSRTQPAGQSVLDLMTPDSVRYGSPTNIRYGNDEYSTEPMDVVKIRKALEKISKSGDLSTAIGSDIIKLSMPFNQRREGQFVVNRILEKLGRGDAPSGVVAYRTEDGIPENKVRGMFKRASSESAPDTIAIFGNKSASANPNQAEFLLHELIHSGEKEGSKMSMTSKYDSHNKEFKKAIDKTLQNRTLRDLLISAMTGKNTDGNFLDMITR
mgnify:CR=1 FL=1|jgi:hypothetical protein|tara:strand:+ start:1107 stop:1796 length:690 start_codon:yes stop_codon:yes gene_type:complete